MKKVLISVLIATMVCTLLISGISCSKSPPQLPPPSSPTETPAPTSQPTTTPESTEEEPKSTLPPMKTFTSETMGFSVDYPETWKVKENSPSSIGILHPALIVQLHIIVYDADWQREWNVHSSEEQVNWHIKMNRTYDFKLLSKPSNINIGGFPACEVDWTHTSDESYYRHIAIQKGQEFLIISGILYESLYRPELDAMFNSFRFTNR